MFIFFKAGVVDVSQIIRSSQPQIPERPTIPRRPQNFEPKVETQCVISPDSTKTDIIQQQNDAQNDAQYQAPSAIYEEIKDDIVSQLLF